MDELEISGKRYISTRRAGREHGYHSDYIGQLIRGGKVAGQKVGRAWYVDEESLAIYLGKPYVASKTEVAVETSAPIEIPKPVEVKETPVVHEEEKPKEIKQQIKSEIKKEIAEVADSGTKIQIKTEKPLFINTSSLTYIADTEPLLPHIPERMMPKEDRFFTAESVPQNLHTYKKAYRAGALIVLLGLFVLGASATLASILTANTSVIEGQTATVYYSLGQ